MRCLFQRLQVRVIGIDDDALRTNHVIGIDDEALRTNHKRQKAQRGKKHRPHDFLERAKKKSDAFFFGTHKKINKCVDADAAPILLKTIRILTPTKPGYNKRSRTPVKK
jgi:hypothetical protein